MRLEPGEGIYLDAGNLHAYCRGLGVEVMANSDNVLRGGLTAKHVDVPELARVLRFTSLVNPRTSNDAGWFEVPVEEFDMRMVTAMEESPWSAQIPGPRVVLCTAGQVTVTVGPATQVLHPTEAVWISAAEEPLVQVTGAGQAFVVGVGARLSTP